MKKLWFDGEFVAKADEETEARVREFLRRSADPLFLKRYNEALLAHDADTKEKP